MSPAKLAIIIFVILRLGDIFPGSKYTNIRNINEIHHVSLVTQGKMLRKIVRQPTGLPTVGVTQPGGQRRSPKYFMMNCSH